MTPHHRSGRVLRRAGLALLTLLLAANAPRVEAGQDPDRPRIALVLSGGGARGAAHVGVLRVLEEARIPVDVVVGTSMGAIVGGLYAAGMGPAELETAIVDTDWEDVFTDKPPRGERYFQRKQSGTDFLVRYRVHFAEGGARLPLGVLQAQKLENLLTFYEITTESARDFDRLPLPFRAVATDLATGERVVLEDGSLAAAMRASMSIPGVFPPVERDGRLLVDGGVAANLPIEVAQELGVDVVVAVDISTPLDPADVPDSAVSVVRRLTGFLTKGNVYRSEAELGEADILIRPDLGTLRVSDFQRSPEAIAIGAAAAREALDRLLPLAVDAEQWERWLQRHRRQPAPPPVITDIVLRNEGPVNDAILLSHLEATVGEPLDIERLSESLSMLYGLGYFEPIAFDVVPGPDGSILEIETRTLRVGLLTALFNLVIEDDFDGGDTYGLEARLERLAANRRGAEWRADLRLGDRAGLSTSFYQPLDSGLRWFIEPEGLWERDENYLVSEGRRLARFRLTDARARLAVGRNLARWGRARIGVQRGRLSAEIEVPQDLIPPDAQAYAGWFADLAYDTLDSPIWPRSGGRGEVAYADFEETLGGELDHQELRLEGSWAWTLGGTTFLPALEAQIDAGGAENRSVAPAELGGLFRLSGYEPFELFGEQSLLGRVVVYRQLGQTPLVRLLRPGWYVGGSLEAGNVFEADENLDAGELLFSASLFIGADTVLGPVHVGVGFGEGDRSRFYFSIGRRFF